ncbi:MAG: hypothetical protein ACRD0H_25430, partial [Actinomycetes bacterium]
MTETAYDYLGRVTAEGRWHLESRQIAWTRIERNDAMRTLRVSEGGAETVLKYDSAGRLIESTDPSGAKIRFGYSGSEVTRTEDNPTATHQTVSTLGGVGKVTQERLASGKQLFEAEYDLDGNVVRFTGEGVLPRYYSYDAYGRPAGELGLDTNWDWARYRYDGNDRLTYFAEPPQAGAQTQYAWAYDAQDRLVEELNPLGRRTRMGYQVGSERLLARSVPGLSLAYGYDGVGRLASERTTTPQGVDTKVFSYDAGDRVVRAEGSGGAVTFGWDSLGRKTHEESTWAPFAVGHDYDLYGRLMTTLVPGAEMMHVRDASGRLESVDLNNTRLATWQYAAGKSGGPVAVQYGNGTRQVSGYDGRGRWKALALARGGESLALMFESLGIDGVARQRLRWQAGSALFSDYFTT